jgi:hypothetical protein
MIMNVLIVLGLDGANILENIGWFQLVVLKVSGSGKATVLEFHSVYK